MQSASRIAAALLVAICLSAAPLGGSAQQRAATPEFHFQDSADHVRIARVERPSNDAAIAVIVVIERGYHINANPASDPYLIPTMLKLTNATPLRVQYPTPLNFKPDFADHAIDVYEGTIRIAAEFAPGTLSDVAHLAGILTVQACTDKICLPPADLPLPSGQPTNFSPVPPGASGSTPPR